MYQLWKCCKRQTTYSSYLSLLSSILNNSTVFVGFASLFLLLLLSKYDNTCSFQEAVNESDIDEILMGMASQITEREDMIITPDLRGNVPTCRVSDIFK